MELMELDLRERIANSDPRDYKTVKGRCVRDRVLY